MSQPPTLPLFDRKLLCVIEIVVPRAERPEWIRNWQAELWHMHRRHPGLAATADLSIGLTRDAFWLRAESWRRTFSGSAILCQATLLGLALLSAMIAVTQNASSRSLRGELPRSLVAAIFVVFVTYATAPPRHIQLGSAGKFLSRIGRHLFFASKVAQITLSCFLFSSDLTHPLRLSMPNVADVLQIFSFVVMALLGMRWAFRDQDQRCKECLHTLAAPARVGRPTHNLLEWNGSELACKDGHGLLSVPEMETSWRQSSHWIDAGWDGTALS